MENNNGGKPKEQPMDITAELIKLYRDDPISHNVIQYLLAKYKIIPVNALESIRQHREEILLNIVLYYKKMWEMRKKIILNKIQTSIKPAGIIYTERKEENEDNQAQGKGNRPEDNVIEGDNKKGDRPGEINKEGSQGA